MSAEHRRKREVAENVEIARLTQQHAERLASAVLDTEQRVTSDTGGQKGQKLAQLGALDPATLGEVARVAGMGAAKYERYNYLKGYPWSLSFDALCRHLLAFWGGEDTDPESGLSHMGHVAWHALALIAFTSRHPDFDDRPPR